jgi:hypothetical protein
MIGSIGVREQALEKAIRTCPPEGRVNSDTVAKLRQGISSRRPPEGALHFFDNRSGKKGDIHEKFKSRVNGDYPFAPGGVR